MREIQDRDDRRLVVGVDQNTLRLGYFDPAQARMRGFDIDLAREVARAIFGGDPDDHITFKAVTTGQREAAIVRGEVDIIASAYTITCGRRTRMFFSSVYYVARQRLLVPAGSSVSSLEDLAGVASVRRGVRRPGTDSAGTGVVRHPVALRADCLVALEQGEVDAVTSDDAILLGCRIRIRRRGSSGRACVASATGWRSTSTTRSSCASSTPCSRGCASAAG